MLRGPKIYPSVATRWLDDIGVTVPQTRESYTKTLRAFQARLDRVGDVRFVEITPEQVRDFVEVGEDGRRRADRTRARHLGVIWRVFAWASDPEVDIAVVGNPAARLRAQAARRAPRDVRRRVWLSEDQARVLIRTTRGDGTDAIDGRDATLIALYLYTGLRLEELIRIRWSQVDFSTGAHGELVGVVRKGGKVTDVPLNAASRRELFAWRARFIEACGANIDGLGIIPQTVCQVVGAPSDALDVCVNDYRVEPSAVERLKRRRWEDGSAICPACGKRVRIVASRGTLWRHGRLRSGQARQMAVIWTKRVTSPSTIRDRVALRAAAAGISHLAPHDLRRSFAGMLQDRQRAAGRVDLDEIRSALAHEHLATTERYLKQRTTLPDAAAGLDFG